MAGKDERNRGKSSIDLKKLKSGLREMDSRGKKRQRIRSEKNSSETFSRAASKKQNPIFRRIFHETKKNNQN